jgi:hypothetical protein
LRTARLRGDADRNRPRRRASLALPAAAAGRSFVIQGDHTIGGYAVKRDGSLQGAIREFGRPTSLQGREEFCTARWPALGLRIVFYNLGGQNPCLPRYGRFSDALLTGKRWRTSSGLRIGDTRSDLLRLHPRARPSPLTRAWWWLVTRISPFGEGGPYGALSAKLNRGRVSAFSVVYPAGGD